MNICDTNLPMPGGPAAGASALDGAMQQLCEEAQFPYIERLEFGSNFCPLEFLRSTWDMKMQLWQGFSQRYSVPLTLVLPITNESLLPALKRRVAQLLQDYKELIDEVVVNDYGMLEWVSNSFEVNLGIGRLFSKDLRDPRYAEAFPAVYRPALLTGGLALLKEQYPRITFAEFDPAGWSVDLSGAPLGVVPALHTPYFFASTGRICEAASAQLGHPFSAGPANEHEGAANAAPASAPGPMPTAPAAPHGPMPAVPGSPEIAANNTRLRAETVCKHQCVRAMTTYAIHPTYTGTLEDDPARVLYYTKRGKTVYCLNDGVQAVGPKDGPAGYAQDVSAGHAQDGPAGYVQAGPAGGAQGGPAGYSQGIPAGYAQLSHAGYDYRLVHTPRHFGWAGTQ